MKNWAVHDSKRQKCLKKYTQRHTHTHLTISFPPIKKDRFHFLLRLSLPCSPLISLLPWGRGGRCRWRCWGSGVSLVSHLIVVGGQLMEQLFDAVFLSRAVHVGHLVLGQGAVVLMNLRRRGRERSNTWKLGLQTQTIQRQQPGGATHTHTNTHNFTITLIYSPPVEA